MSAQARVLGIPAALALFACALWLRFTADGWAIVAAFCAVVSSFVLGVAVTLELIERMSRRAFEDLRRSMREGHGDA